MAPLRLSLLLLLGYLLGSFLLGLLRVRVLCIHTHAFTLRESFGQRPVQGLGALPLLVVVRYSWALNLLIRQC